MRFRWFWRRTVLHGDGHTDDWRALQEAIDKGETIPPGTYVVSNGIRIPAHQQTTFRDLRVVPGRSYYVKNLSRWPFSKEKK